MLYLPQLIHPKEISRHLKYLQDTINLPTRQVEIRDSGRVCIPDPHNALINIAY